LLTAWWSQVEVVEAIATGKLQEGTEGILLELLVLLQDLELLAEGEQRASVARPAVPQVPAELWATAVQRVVSTVEAAGVVTTVVAPVTTLLEAEARATPTAPTYSPGQG
jgi:hypothetical protein